MENDIMYFAVALNDEGQIEQIKVLRRNGQLFFWDFTGTIYKSKKEAEADLIKLNCRV